MEKAGVYIGIEATSLRLQDGRVRAISQSPALSDVINQMPKLAKTEKGVRSLVRVIQNFKYNQIIPNSLTQPNSVRVLLASSI